MANILGTISNDFLTGTASADSILGFAGNDTLLGLAGNDIINGNQDNDVLNGNQGNDTVRGGIGNDFVRGGQGNDLLFGDIGNDTIFGDLGNDTIFGSVGNDLINGNEGNDIINGNEGNDTVRGGMGNDLVQGGQGNDQVYGDLGNDSLFGDQGNDTVFGAQGNDLVFGNQGDDFLNGNEGNDTVRGGQGDDFVRGGQNDDILYGDLGNDTVYGDLGNDTLYGSEGDDLLFGNQGNDVLNGNEGNDTLYGGQGNDLVRGGQNDDVLFGDLGDDTVYGDTNNDVVFGGQGNDLLFGNQGDDVINGNEGNDTIFGGQGSDLLRGGQGNDSIFGDRGSDTLFGDLGADTLTGDSGGESNTDVFVIGKGMGGTTRAGADIITDWQTCIDLISLTGGLSYADVNIQQGTGTDTNNTIITDKASGEFLAVLLNTSSNLVDGTSFTPAGPPKVSITATNPTTAEATPAVSPGLFTVSIPCEVETALTVNYTIAGTATNGTDYSTISSSVTIPAGSKSATISVTPIDDTSIESTETVTLTLASGTGYSVAASPNNTATVSILDNDSATTKPIVFVTAPTPTTQEGSSTPTFQFSRTGGDITQAVTIKYVVSGTATAGTDYNALSGSVTIPAGQSVSSLINITSTDDNLFEPTEFLSVSISEDPSYLVGSQSSSTVSIQDNDTLSATANTNPVLRYNSSGTFLSGHTDITSAVNAANNNDIIVVKAGNYSEAGSIVINKPLTIRGPNAGISPSSGFAVSPAIVSVATANTPVFTILPGTNGVTIEGLRIQLNGDNAIRYQSTVANNNIVIRQNEFTGTGPAGGGVIYTDFGGASSSSATITDNLIRDVTSGTVTSAIQAFRINTITITDNTIANLNGPGIVADAITNPASVINHNTVSKLGQQGIQLAGGNATIANNDITNVNSSSGSDRGGIRLRNSGFTGVIPGTVNVTGNTITNSFNGLAVNDLDNITGNSIKINYNNFIGNTNAGIYHGGTGTLEATNNWFDTTSPTLGTQIKVPNGGTVNYTPFATQPF